MVRSRSQLTRERNKRNISLVEFPRETTYFTKNHLHRWCCCRTTIQSIFLFAYMITIKSIKAVGAYINECYTLTYALAMRTFVEKEGCCIDGASSTIVNQSVCTKVVVRLSLLFVIIIGQ